MNGVAGKESGMATVAGMWWGSVVGCALVWSVGVAAVGQPPTQTPRAVAAKMTNPVPSTPASIASGQALYGKYCRFCHGATAQGDSPSAPKDMKPSNLTDATWDRGSSPGEIFVVIQEGAGPEFKMKGLKGKVSEQDTWHIVNYVRSLGGVAK
jgi:mono/diheme cytochrome c family protein